ncbi:exodeoxyribonuclease III [Nostoc sp. MBR 210]|uniref:Exodeoxyribonuclease III n=1 Tax=Nostoc piscinale CENA21 TaxID=224013 RepID=A0A0M5TIH8_9NOSO|nr:exodeoxyribonuclease III [Nostoc piscinale]ALF53450.1 exodeoxyribonuclease III [Nostoc piscinale CENA21]OCQ89330.1 exodeoxyribonuclease III [Nostoc sp. MBR 210]
MKIVTWNVNSIRTRLEQVIYWLRENPVDVLCLQETKVIDADFPRSPFVELGYHLYISGQKAYNGVALISRQPLKDVSAGFTAILPHLEPEWDEQKRVITGVIDDIRIVNLYVPNGSAIGSEKYEFKLRWLTVLREYLQFLLKSQSAICICGDFNIALESIDIHDKVNADNHIMSSPAERQALRDILELGFADAFRKFTTEGGHYSWWDYRTAAFRRNLGWRIDHHYLTPVLYERAKSCIIDVNPRTLPQPSDHTPVIVELE